MPVSLRGIFGSISCLFIGFILIGPTGGNFTYWFLIGVVFALLYDVLIISRIKKMESNMDNVFKVPRSSLGAVGSVLLLSTVLRLFFFKSHLGLVVDVASFGVPIFLNCAVLFLYLSIFNKPLADKMFRKFSQ